ncbi:hypothetical protein WA026_003965 [Henosepilachna vigintioctopunctata]|uniref:Uncharacterized protein n=1 Tax=Henosepilachna vigintioctopunctata TaxID=420089 RepID=A0AAW1UG53_9CUCU
MFLDIPPMMCSIILEFAGLQEQTVSGGGADRPTPEPANEAEEGNSGHQRTERAGETSAGTKSGGRRRVTSRSKLADDVDVDGRAAQPNQLREGVLFRELKWEDPPPRTGSVRKLARSENGCIQKTPSFTASNYGKGFSLWLKD